jgi:hypothetical protein
MQFVFTLASNGFVNDMGANCLAFLYLFLLNPSRNRPFAWRWLVGLYLLPIHRAYSRGKVQPS